MHKPGLSQANRDFMGPLGKNAALSLANCIHSSR